MADHSVARRALERDSSGTAETEAFNQARTPYPDEKLIHQLFEEHAARAPNAPAVAFQSRSLTYAELNARANQLAWYLREHGVGPDRPVGLCVERSLEMAVGLLGVLKAGGAYVPLDPDYPVERLHTIVKDCAPGVLLTQERLKKKLPLTAAQPIELDRRWNVIAGYSTENPEPARIGLRSDHLAYVIYTSGSSGAPKGVLVEHRSVLSLWQGLEHIYRRVARCERVAANASFSFDASVKQFVQWLSGRTVVIVPQEYRWDASLLLSFIAEQRIDAIDCTPSQLKTWIAAGLHEKRGRHHVSLVLVGGEPIDAELWHLLARCPHIDFYNVYGPTESTVDTTFARLRDDVSPPHIGRPMENRRVYILDETGKPVSVGTEGEMFIGGAGVARGYLNRPELTAQKFLPDPFVADPNARMYKSGDLARWRIDGTLEYLGRNDQQVKIRGFRIELAEIQAELARHEAVKSAAVIAREDGDGEKRLVAYVVPDRAKLKASSGERSGGALSEDLVTQWHLVHESTYESRQTELEPSFVGWNSSYTGRPIDAQEMDEWLARTVERVSALKPRTVLEIGCGVGLVLQHIAPHCAEYLACDFSAAALQRLQAWLNTQPGLSHVQLLQRTAADLRDLPRAKFDTVILNSVVQYFPDARYLFDVLRESAALLAEGGRIFVGDVRHLGLLEVFHGAVQLARAPEHLTIGQLRNRIALAVEQEKELLLDPRFFAELPLHLPAITAIEIQLKRGAAHNELTRYRYDVVLHVGHISQRRADHCDRWDGGRAVQEQLQDLARRTNGLHGAKIEGIPNRRVCGEIAAWRSIVQGKDDERITELRARPGDEGVDPEEICRWAEDHGYEAHLSWSTDAERGEFDALFWRRGAESYGRVIARIEARSAESFVEPWASQYANDPSAGRLQQNLPAELRDALLRRLPDYMVPSAFVVLERLPLTSHGKLDARALPAPSLGSYATRPYEAPQGEVEEILAGIWQGLLRVERVGRQDNFFELGGHSLMIVQMLERLRHLGLSADLRGVFESPTLADLAGALSGGVTEEFHAPPNLIPVGCNVITPRMLPLVELEQEHIDRIVSMVSDGAANIQDIYPLAPLQEGILFHHLLSERGGDIYVIPTVLAVSSRQRLEELIAALQEVINRHDVLRTAVLSEHLPRPVQVVYRCARLPVEEIALDRGRDAMEQIREWIRPDRQQMDLRKAPLLRLTIASDPRSERWYAVLQSHHIVSDHESLDIIIAEIVAHLEGQGQLLPTAMPYRNHVAQVLTHARMHDPEAFFRSKLADVVAPTAPFGLLDVHGDGSDIEELTAELDVVVARRIRTQARRLGVSAATLFHAAWSLVIACISGRDDVVFGTVLLGRMHGSAGAQRTLGMFINTLPLRLHLQGVTVQELVMSTQRELAELLNYEQASLAVAQRCSGIKGPGPLFSALLNYAHNTAKWDAKWAGAKGIELLTRQERTNYPLTLSIEDLGEAFALIVHADRRIDAHRVTAYLHRAVHSLVEALELAPQTPALSLSSLPESERHQVIESFNATQVPYPQDKLLHELFEMQVRRHPQAAAVAYEGQSLTYAELNERANRVAWYLREKGVGPDQLVALCVGRGLEMVVGLLGILKAGGAYVPLDPDYPADRLRYMLEDAGPRVVLTQEKFRANLSGSAAELISLDGQWREIANKSTSDLETGAIGLRSHHLAYVIYTSGSTGKPKGVMVEHRSVISLWQGLEQIYRDSPDCRRVAVNASFNFDGSVKQFVQLLSGRTIVLVPQEVRWNAPALIDYIAEQRIHAIDCTPSQLRLWIAAGLLERERLPLRLALVGGEPIDAELWTRLASATRIDFINVYGPTESTVDTSFARLKGDLGAQHIGRVMENRRVYILDANRRPVPIGVGGEMYIGGAGVARGYLNRSDLTAERFLPDPFSADPGARVYRTGDLARWRSDGAIEYLGRNDDQVKIRGYRMELGEIEAELARQPSVSEATVIAREDMPGEKRLAAYFVPRDPSNPPVPEELRTRLKSVLPDYMVPGAFVALERMPLTPNGKIDRRALPIPETAAYAAREYEPPQGEVEEILAMIWRDVLGAGRVGRGDDFFDLGGHSLLAMQVITRIESSIFVEAPVRWLFEFPTLRDLSVRVEELRRSRLLDELAQGGPEIDDLLDAVESMPESSARELLRKLNMEAGCDNGLHFAAGTGRNALDGEDATLGVAS